MLFQPPPPYTQKDPTENDSSGTVHIAIMGPTGSGKSTFINLVSDSKLAVSNKLLSCTQRVELADCFDLDGRTVCLIDTPGFDDTVKSDADILASIAAFLATHYKEGMKLHGVIYLHRITDQKMSGVSVRTFRLFRKLCGDATLKNVMIITTMWDDVQEKQGEDRESQLRSDDRFFKLALDQGAKMLRHHNTKESAQNIVRGIFANHPVKLKIQHEVVDLGKSVYDTEAGKEVNRDIQELIKKHEEEIEALKEELTRAFEGEIQSIADGFRAALRRSEDDRARLISGVKNMAANFEAESTRVHKELQLLKSKLEEIEESKQEIGFFTKLRKRFSKSDKSAPRSQPYASNGRRNEKSTSDPELRHSESVDPGPTLPDPTAPYPSLIHMPVLRPKATPDYGGNYLKVDRSDRQRQEFGVTLHNHRSQERPVVLPSQSIEAPLIRIPTPASPEADEPGSVYRPHSAAESSTPMPERFIHNPPPTTILPLHRAISMNELRPDEHVDNEPRLTFEEGPDQTSTLSRDSRPRKPLISQPSPQERLDALSLRALSRSSLQSSETLKAMPKAASRAAAADDLAISSQPIQYVPRDESGRDLLARRPDDQTVPMRPLTIDQKRRRQRPPQQQNLRTSRNVLRLPSAWEPSEHDNYGI